MPRTIKDKRVNIQNDNIYCAECGAELPILSCKNSRCLLTKLNPKNKKDKIILDKAKKNLNYEFDIDIFTNYKKPTEKKQKEIIQKPKIIPEETNLSTYKNSNTNNTIEKNAYDKFIDGTLDLPTAFWVFGIFGSFIISLILTLIAESFNKIFYIPFVFVNGGIILFLWSCAENYKKEKLRKKQSAVWGYLTQIFCVLAAGGLINTVLDIVKTL